MASSVRAPDGRLLVLLPGMGAVSTTLVAGVELIRRGASSPIGSLTQMATFDERADSKALFGRTFAETLPLTPLANLAFAGWDIHGEDALTVARRSEVLSSKHIDLVADGLGKVKPMPGVHDPKTVRRLPARDTLNDTHRRAQADALRQQIKDAKKANNASRAVAVMLTSTEVQQSPSGAHESIKAFELGLDKNDEAITPFQLYLYACLQEGVGFANGTPNMTVELPVFRQLSLERGVPIAGRDLKTGQTMMKTVIAPALRARMLGVRGWFSANILGNTDGQVLDDRDAFKSKETTKRQVLDTILEPERFPSLYKDLYHKVEINYYPPRGDNKEGWDNIDLFGWLGYDMQLKIDFLCRDSILAAPLALDLALLLDLGQRSGQSGLQDWLSFFFKAPVTRDGGPAMHDLFAQYGVLQKTLASLANAK